MNDRCNNCTEKCPQADMAHQAAMGRMYATNEFVNLQKKIDSGELVEVVRCKKCAHCTVTSDGMVCDRALPTKRMEDYYIYGSTVLARVAPDDFCSHGERRTDHV